jgi:hypothetical protein
LSDDEPTAEPRARNAVAEGCGLVFERGGKLRVGELQRGREAKYNPAGHREDEGIGEDSGARIQIETESEIAPELRRQHLRYGSPDQSSCQNGEYEAGDAAAQRQQNTLCEQLPDHATAARSERQSNGDLPLPSRTARKQQIGDIGARDEEHHGHDQHQSREPRLRSGYRRYSKEGRVLQGHFQRAVARQGKCRRIDELTHRFPPPPASDDRRLESSEHLKFKIGWLPQPILSGS